MSDAVSCVVADDVSSKDYGDLFSVACGLVDCTGIDADGYKGKYGAYSFCNAKDQLSFVLNLYYLKEGSASSACDFSGSASLKSATTASSCSSVLSQAGSSGLGTISGSVSGTATGSHSGSSATGSSGASTTGSSASKAGASPAYGISLTMSLGGLLSLLFL